MVTLNGVRQMYGEALRWKFCGSKARDRKPQPYETGRQNRKYGCYRDREVDSAMLHDAAATDRPKLIGRLFNSMSSKLANNQKAVVHVSHHALATPKLPCAHTHTRTHINPPLHLVTSLRGCHPGTWMPARTADVLKADRTHVMSSVSLYAYLQVKPSRYMPVVDHPEVDAGLTWYPTPAADVNLRCRLPGCMLVVL